MANPFMKVREQIVGDNLAGDQSVWLVDASLTGDVLVFWQGGGSRIQTFDSDGNEVSPEIPAQGGAAWLSDGSFVVYRSTPNAGTDIDRYSRDGTLLDSTVFFAGDPIPGGFSPPVPRDLVLLASGNFAALYVDVNSGNWGVKILNPALDVVASNTNLGITVFVQTQHRFEALSDGGFVAFRQEPNGQSGEIIRYSGTGAKVGDTIFPGAEDIAALPDGGFVAVRGGVSDGDSVGVFARIYNADGTVRVPEFLVNTNVSGVQSSPNVVALGDDLLVVTWGPSDIYAQVFDLTGRKIGSEVLLDPGAGAGGWRVDALDDDTIVITAQINGNGKDVELTYWDVRANLEIGTAGDDTLDGGGAQDLVLVGLGGNDTYNVDSAGDEVQEAVGEGNDRIRTSVSFTIAPGQEVEILQTDNNIGTAPLQLTGNEFSQYIFGNYGANRIDGGGGADTMLGFAGDDWYFVDNAADQVRENVGEGFDRVSASVSYVLTAGQGIELLSTANNIGTDPLILTGNAFAQYIFGNAGNNRLEGGGGGDVMLGLEGVDLYIVSHAGDQVREAVGAGNGDAVYARVSHALLAGQEIEILVVEDAGSTAAIDLAGNEFSQRIDGNAGNNRLTGGGGIDVFTGYAGDDTYVVDAGATVFDGAGQGFDRIFSTGSYELTSTAEIEVITPLDEFGTAPLEMRGNGFGQYVYGNDGNNLIDGRGGGDILVGRGGDDLLFVRNAADQIREEGNDGFDRVLAEISWQLNANARVEMITTTDNLGTAAINLTGNEFAQYVYGNEGANRLNGGAGKDVLNGFGGSDFFVFDTALNTAFTANFDGLADSANVDRIDGFSFDDKIVLSGTLFGFTPGALPAGAFNTGTTATEADDRILWDAASRSLLFDPDGTGAQGAQLIAVLSAPFNLDSTFIVVA
jgi:Ca2+-binding RTX toxin-like protein